MSMKFSKILFVAVFSCGFLWIAGCKQKPASEFPSASRNVFGSEVTITIYDPGHTTADLMPVFDDAFKFLADWDKKTLKPGADNQIYHISSGAGEQSVTTDSSVFQMLMKSIRFYDNSGKVFDIRYGPMMDAWGFGGKPHVPSPTQLDTLKAYVTEGGMFVAGNGILLAKPGMKFDVREIAVGYAFDLLAASFAQKGFRTVTIHSPYVWRLMGDPADKRGFEVTIKDPIKGDSTWATVWAPAGGVAYAAKSKDHFESGGKSYHSLLDPRNGMPAEKCLGTIVQAADAATAQAFAYGTFVWGSADSLDANGKQAIAGVAIITGSAGNPQVKANGSLAGKIETRK